MRAASWVTPATMIPLPCPRQQTAAWLLLQLRRRRGERAVAGRGQRHGGPVAIGVLHAQHLELAVERRTLHADEGCGARDIAAEARDLGQEVLALEHFAC